MSAYDPIADWYAAQARTGSHRHFLDHLARGLLEMAGDVCGKRVLDAGCGEGRVARLFARRRAEVVAVDISPRLLHLARTFEAEDPHEVEFIQADLAKGLPCNRGAFDLATANMMLDDCEDLAGVFATLADALKADGRLLLSMNNPYAIVTRGKVDDYFASGPLTQSSARSKRNMRSPSTTECLRSGWRRFARRGSCCAALSMSDRTHPIRICRRTPCPRSCCSNWSCAERDRPISASTT